MDAIKNLSVELIDPSPFQARRKFKNIEELAKSIQDIGLIEPIIVRPMDGRFELIAGERRWRATKLTDLETILAIERDVDDSTARRMSLEENIKRDDLTRIEEIDAWILHVDAELWEDGEYRSYVGGNDWPDEFDNQQARLRARWLLKKLDSDRQSDYVNSFHKFVERVNIIFSQHPRNVKWRSFLNHDIPLLDLPEPVLEIAIDKNLNKSQTKALGKIAEEDSTEAQEILETGKVTVRGEDGYEQVDIEDASSREIEKAPLRARLDKMGLGTAHVSYNEGEDEWYTPREIIEAARSVMGRIDLDPASTQTANTVVKAIRYYTQRDDGLSKEWRGKVWLNPPYAQPLIERFITKLVKHVRSKDVPEAIVLVNNATETSWFVELIGVAGAVCFPQGRVKFWHPQRISAPLQGQAIIYVGIETDKFLARFQQFGWTARIFKSIDESGNRPSVS